MESIEGELMSVKKKTGEEFAGILSERLTGKRLNMSLLDNSTLFDASLNWSQVGSSKIKESYITI